MANEEMNAALRQGFGKGPARTEDKPEKPETPDLTDLDLDGLFALNEAIADELRTRFDAAVGEDE
jgi:hypothetical protein